MHPQPAPNRRNTKAPNALPTARGRLSTQGRGDTGAPVSGPCAALIGFDPGLEAEGLAGVLRSFDKSLHVLFLADPSELVIDDQGRDLGWILLDADGMGPTIEAGIAEIRARTPASRVLVLGRSEHAPDVDRLMRLGAAAYIPRRFTQEAILAVLALVHAGERFRPTPQNASHEVESDPQGNAEQSRTLREFGLTKAEENVLILVAQGKTNLQIAQALNKKEGTVRVQMSAILDKLKVRNRAAAILVAMRDPSMIGAQLARVQENPLDLDWLYQHMDFRRYRAGEVLFRKGDLGREMYIVQRGCVTLKELGLEMREGDIFGEIAIFAPNHRRTSTAVCSIDTDVFVLAEDKVRQMHYVNPAFALTVLQLITNRLLADRQRGED